MGSTHVLLHKLCYLRFDPDWPVANLVYVDIYDLIRARSQGRALAEPNAVGPWARAQIIWFVFA